MKRILIRYCKVWNYLPRAARAAALIKEAAGVDAELREGARGEFTVWVGEDQVAAKDRMGFPSETDILAAVQSALARGW